MLNACVESVHSRVDTDRRVNGCYRASIRRQCSAIPSRKVGCHFLDREQIAAKWPGQRLSSAKRSASHAGLHFDGRSNFRASNRHEKWQIRFRRRHWRRRNCRDKRYPVPRQLACHDRRHETRRKADQRRIRPGVFELYRQSRCWPRAGSEIMRGRSLISKKPIEFKTLGTSGERCAVQSGNVFAQ